MDILPRSKYTMLKSDGHHFSLFLPNKQVPSPSVARSKDFLQSESLKETSFGMSGCMPRKPFRPFVTGH
ncbi:hypothetical protein TNCT_654721 [Trichonephila clavata]|uniref:Uncharacterized protein n=1 Tax=Trichonephila clavata TaxID=2740835 RepID=A0A8X6L2U3_TRICU|nr:hypothetical protein TNCT_654721 [Trichonephila clavata]